MMSGPFSPNHDDGTAGTLPGWMGDALRAPVASRPEARARIMAQVRALPAPHRLSVPLVQHASRWRRRGSVTGLGGALLTALLTMAVGVRQGDRVALAQRVHPTAIIVGDSAVPVRGADSLAAIVSGRLLDTMKVVDYVVRGANVQRVQVQHAVRDPRARDAHPVPFHPTRLTRVSVNEWRVRALLPRDAVAVSFSVNDLTLDPVPVRTGSATL
ncbi:hypothetical protein [Gemmatimonas sp.]|jgi:hypothetical protein|uniref:hypothetical protein n=1 Tax=Gemmatimonas sp. TaxID=1962908 RepID=UPI0037BE3539